MTNNECSGSRRGTALNDAVVVGGAYLARCGVCGRLVSIAIDGRAIVHPAK